MPSLNKACLIGRATADPTLRYTAAGQPVTSFSIATNHYASGSDGDRKEYTDYHNIVAWNIGNRELAQWAGDNLCKGSLIYVEGRLQTRSWEGQDGEKRRTTEVVAFDIQLLNDARDREPVSVGADRMPGVSSDEIPF